MAEVLVWGDQHDQRFFDFFLENNIITLFIKILNQKTGRDIKVQLIQTISLLVENLGNENSLYYLFSSNYMNAFITYKFDFSDDEILAYYISLLKTLSLKLNQNSIQFFFNEMENDFPLYTEAIQFFTHKDPMIRIAVRTLSLNCYKVEDEATRKYILGKPAPYFSNIVWFIRNQSKELENFVLSCTHAQRYRLEDNTAELLDNFYYIHDIINLKIPSMQDVLTEHLLNFLLLPQFVGSLMEDGALEDRLHPFFSIFFLSQIFSIYNYKPLVDTLAAALILPERRFLKFAEKVSKTKCSVSVLTKRYSSALNLQKLESLSSSAPNSESDFSSLSGTSPHEIASNLEQPSGPSDPDSTRSLYYDSLISFLEKKDDRLVLTTLCLMVSFMKNSALNPALVELSGLSPYRVWKAKRILESLTFGADQSETFITRKHSRTPSLNANGFSLSTPMDANVLPPPSPSKSLDRKRTQTFNGKSSLRGALFGDEKPPLDPLTSFVESETKSSLDETKKEENSLKSSNPQEKKLEISEVKIKSEEKVKNQEDHVTEPQEVKGEEVKEVKEVEEETKKEENGKVDEISNEKVKEETQGSHPTEEESPKDEELPSEVKKEEILTEGNENPQEQTQSPVSESNGSSEPTPEASKVESNGETTEESETIQKSETPNTIPAPESNGTSKDEPSHKEESNGVKEESKTPPESPKSGGESQVLKTPIKATSDETVKQTLDPQPAKKTDIAANGIDDINLTESYKRNGNLIVDKLLQILIRSEEYRVITLQMTILLFKELTASQDMTYNLTKDQLDLVKRAYGQSVDSVKKCLKGSLWEVFLEIFENELRTYKQLSFDSLMRDCSALLLPVSNTSASGIGKAFSVYLIIPALPKRMPAANSEAEKNQYAIQAFLILRELVFSILRKKDDRLPLKEAHVQYKVKDNLLIDPQKTLVSTHQVINSNNSKKKLKRYLVLYANSLIVTEPELRTSPRKDSSLSSNSIICNIIPLQTIQIELDKTEPFSLYLVSHPSTWSATFAFESEEACKEAQSLIEKAKCTIRDDKMSQIEQMLNDQL